MACLGPLVIESPEEEGRYEAAVKATHDFVNCLRDKDLSDAQILAIVELVIRQSSSPYSGMWWTRVPSCYGLQNAPYQPERVIFSGDKTIVFWKDGGKTMVSCAADQPFDEYIGFVAALAKKVYGSTSRVKKILKKTGKDQNPAIMKKREKKAAKKAMNENKEEPKW
jgi:hypothetical protein